VSVVADPLGKFLQPELGPFMFMPVARVSLGPVTYLFSLNTVFGAVLAGLVGLNLALTYLVWRQPKACGIGGKSGGLLASVPALLSGTACCGPVVLIVLGVQASGVLLRGSSFSCPPRRFCSSGVSSSSAGRSIRRRCRSQCRSRTCWKATPARRAASASLSESPTNSVSSGSVPRPRAAASSGSGSGL